MLSWIPLVGSWSLKKPKKYLHGSLMYAALLSKGLNPSLAIIE